MLFTLNAQTNYSLLEAAESLSLFTWMILDHDQWNKVEPCVVKKVDYIPTVFREDVTVANTNIIHRMRETNILWIKLQSDQSPLVAFMSDWIWKLRVRLELVIDCRYVTSCNLCGGTDPRTPYKCPEGLVKLPPLSCFHRRLTVWESLVYLTSLQEPALTSWSRI